MRIIGLLILIFLSLKAEDDLLINTHIRMLPKIMALDMKISSRAATNKAILAIVYDKSRKSFAQEIAGSINRIYNGQVSSIRFIAIPVSVDELLYSRNDISFVYMIDMDPSSIRRVASWTQENSVPAFAYNPDAIGMGILGSIAIERNTVIYINKNVLRSGKFRFSDHLYQIVRFIE